VAQTQTNGADAAALIGSIQEDIAEAEIVLDSLARRLAALVEALTEDAS
jgi:hypothetical protein